jgi:hypothetical protein
MTDAPQTVWRALAYHKASKKAAWRWFKTREQAEREAAGGTAIYRYELTPDA